MSKEQSDLLNALRIDREAQADEDGGSPGVGWLPALGIGASGLVIGIALGWVLKPAPKPLPAAPSAASTALGKPGAIRAGSLTASGYVVARVRATIAAEVTGRVVDVRVEEGQSVTKGQVLAILDSAIARADQTTAKRGIESADAALAAAQSDQIEAQRALGRAEVLAKTGTIGQASLLTSRARAVSAEAALDLAKAQLASARSQSNRSDVQLSKFEIRAPFTGVVIDKAAQPGEIISPLSAGGGFTRTGICTIVDMDSLEIEVDVNEAYIAKVSAGQAVEAVLDAYPDTVLPAHVIATIPTASRDKATVRVRIALDVKDKRVLPDMAIKVTFLDKRP